MQSNNRKVFDTLMSKTKIYLGIIFILFVIICVENPIMIFPSILMYIAISYFTFKT